MLPLPARRRGQRQQLERHVDDAHRGTHRLHRADGDDRRTPPSPFRNTETMAGTSDDGIPDPNSQVANVTLRWENLDDFTTGTIGTDTSASRRCGPATGTRRRRSSTATTSSTSTSLTSPEHLVTDVATRPVVVDNSPPMIDLVSFTAGSLPQCQYWDGLPEPHVLLQPEAERVRRQRLQRRGARGRSARWPRPTSSSPPRRTSRRRLTA